MSRLNDPPSNPESRRSFLKKSTLVAGVATAAAGTASSANSAHDLSEIAISEDFTKSLKTPPQPASFDARRGMNGASVFAKVCQEEGLAALFCCPGNYTVIKGHEYEYGLGKAVNLISDLFMDLLPEATYYEYMAEHFDMPDE